MNFILSGEYSHPVEVSFNPTATLTPNVLGYDTQGAVENLRNLIYSSTQLSSVSPLIEKFKIVKGYFNLAVRFRDFNFPKITFPRYEGRFQLHCGVWMGDSYRSSDKPDDIYYDSRTVRLPQDLIWNANYAKTGVVTYEFSTGYSNFVQCFGNKYCFVVPMRIEYINDPKGIDKLNPSDLVGDLAFQFTVSWKFQCYGIPSGTVSRGIRPCMFFFCLTF